MTTFWATILLPVETDLLPCPGWSSGPLPVPFSEVDVADATNRATYVDRRAADALYGDGEGRARKHREMDGALAGPFRLVGLEWLQLRDHSALSGVLIAHVSAEVDDPRELLDDWSTLVRWKFDDVGQQILMTEVEAELGVAVRLHAVHQSPFRIAFLDHVADPDPPFPTSALGPVAAWQFALASAVRTGSFVPTDRQVAELEAAQIDLSSDWSAMVLRDGAAFVGHAHVARGFVAEVAGAYVRSIYTDALLLGLLQRLVIGDLADRLAALDDPARHPRAVERLHAEFSRFRNRLWWQHLTQHGPGNELLLEYRKQHRLPELMIETKSELSDYSQQASLRAARVLNLVVTALAFVGAVGVLTQVYRFFVEPPTVPGDGVLWVVAAVLVIVAVLVVAYPLGVLSRLLPRRSRPFVPRGFDPPG